MIDLEESTDKETIHLLIHLLMQFMSRPDLAFPTDEKHRARLMSIVLKHLYLLMGFNQIEKSFQFSSARIRCSSVFNAFMASLPQFLDQNHAMGSMDTLLNFIVHLLIYAPYASTTIPTTFEIVKNGNDSLWHLEVQVRRSWIMAVLVIFYKYNLKMVPETNLACLVRIVMNSLESQYHTCRRIPTTIYQQDLPKKPDVGQSDDEHLSSSKLQMQLKKLSDVSIECDETESELVAIPESDLSDSTLHGSIDGGMSDDVNLLKKVDSKKKHREPVETKKHRPPPIDTSAKTLSEGVRMMFASAVLSPPVNVQKAVIVTQSQYSRSKDSTSTAVASATNNQLKTVSAIAHSESKPSAQITPMYISGPRSPSPTPRVLGRQQRIIDTNGEELKKSQVRALDPNNFYGSPESPLSRMDVLSPPDDTDISTDGTETVDTAMEVKRLELPAPERLLPIGGPSKENLLSIVDRVRDGLSIPDISHLRSNENLDGDKSDLSPPNSSRGASPRRLTKQVALIESPPSGSGGKEIGLKADNLGRDSKRQVSHRVPSKLIDERLRYAGSWAPPSSQDHDDEDETTSTKATSYVSIDTKPVSRIIQTFIMTANLLILSCS